jgi:hypothetical protein
MKTCSYCGRQYSDDATACAVDETPLTAPVESRKKLNGVWRGAYDYQDKMQFGAKIVPFTLVLKQGWLGHFSGKVTEDAPPGLPGVGSIDGYFGWPAIEFTKQMPVGYFGKPDGSMVTYRESFIEQGHACEQELPSSPISCKGTFLDANRVQGVWVVEPGHISLPDGWRVDFPRTSGLWCAEFVTTDTKAKPTTGPQQPFFDRSLLAAAELPDKTNPAFRRLGKFPVADAERLLKRFEKENIRFEINRDDSPVRRMMPLTAITGGYSGTAPMIELFVHPEDEAKAKAIVNEGTPV